MGLLHTADLRLFAERGYLVVPGLVAGEDLDQADAEVDRLIAEAPPPARHVGHHFYWQDHERSPALFAPLRRDGGVLQAAGELVGDTVEVAFEQVQVALNVPPYDHRPGWPHIDGYAPGQETPGTFTLLAGLLLSDQEQDNAGNLWVWPGTHLAHAAFFAERGPEAFATAAGYPDIDLPAPTQIHGRRGDVLFAHYLLGHNIGGNFSSDVTRRALYWRLRTPGHAERWAACLADAWHEYPAVRAAGAQSKTVSAAEGAAPSISLAYGPRSGSGSRARPWWSDRSRRRPAGGRDRQARPG